MGNPSPTANAFDAPTAEFNPFRDTWAYWVDASQRSLLFLDVLQQRSEQYCEQRAKVAPHVLKFGCELIMDGRKLERPVNYLLVRITPPGGVDLDSIKRPFVIVDPRAGHGPGIGGFKPQSEIGVALKAGHPCYFIGFLPNPVPGQTIEDIVRAEAIFLERVIELHPEAEGRPAVIGNCQAGWAVMLVASQRPELFGPIILAGSPLSYWAGKHGENPMRYTGGLLGGSWLTALTGDLGHGKFDGAWLVSNFENLNPANTLWSKQYNLYSKVDSEGPRYLEFEQWWGGHVLLNAEEMQFIADELFVGNKLAAGSVATSDGTHFDLRSITSPIIVFCSKADNITPPPQALDWILDLYESEDEIRAYGQTIIYAVHESIGHLGIFVSGSVAKKEHDEFASNIDLIDVLPPGLYEAVMVPKSEVRRATDLVAGNYLVRFEKRTLDDIRALGGNSDADDRMFETAARVSNVNLGLYRTFLQPLVRAWASEDFAEWTRKAHPLRVQYEMFSPQNPIMGALHATIEKARDNRQPVPAENWLWQTQELYSSWTETWFNAYRDWRDQLCEATFEAVYGSPLLQALVGLNASDGSAGRRLGKDAAHAALVAKRIQELKRDIAEGGPREAAVRALLYVRGPNGAIDERGFNFLRRMREDTGSGMSLAEFKRVVREQFFMLLVDEHSAVQAIPAMLAKDPALSERMRAAVRRIVETLGLRSDEARARFDELEELIEQRAEPLASDVLDPDRAQFTKRRPLPMHPGRAKH
jgi:pimeloyl-ACP methyl ester carboxylesterase